MLSYVPASVIRLVLAGLFVLAATGPERREASTDAPPEAVVRLIALQGDWQDAEFSGLAWRDDDWLLLMPQWPDRFPPDSTTAEEGLKPDGHLFAVDEDAVEDAAMGEAYAPLQLRPVAFFSFDVRESVPGFQGYEALAVVGDSAFLTIEAEVEGIMQGYLVAGVFEDDDGTPTALRLDPETLTPIAPPDLPGGAINLANMSYEALVVTPQELVALYEANGQTVNPYLRTYVFDHSEHLKRALPFPVLEYRVTDATALDRHDRFWVLNT